jgi:hypothetical protein
VATLACNESHGRRTVRVLAALAVLLALCAAAVAVGAGADDARAARAATLGKTKHTPAPQCPGDNCEAVGRMTAFQTKADGKKEPFVVPKSGHLVGWAIDLAGKPSKSENNVFGGLYKHKPFGEAQSARISVLTKRNGTDYRLKSQGPATKLTDYIGEKPIFTLGKELKVEKGDIVAITLPTWSSAFTICKKPPRRKNGSCSGLSPKNNAWRASRSKNRCVVGTSGKPLQNVKKSKPHEDEGSTRTYGCLYEGARLLYWGYYTT